MAGKAFERIAKRKNPEAKEQTRKEIEAIIKQNMEEKEEYKHKFIDFIQGKHKKTLEIETELLNLIELYTDSLKKRIEELEDLLRIEREANKNKAPF